MTMFGIGNKVSTDDAPKIISDENTQATIDDMINESAQVLDLRDLPEGSAICQAIGITDKDGKPGALVISFSKGEVEDDVVTAESERTTIIVPMSQAFVFGNGIILALDKAADALVDDTVKAMVERIFGGDR